jgi:hypothetical protein
MSERRKHAVLTAVGSIWLGLGAALFGVPFRRR